MTVLQFFSVNGFAFLFHEGLGQFQFFGRFHDDDVADLSGGEGIDHRLVFLSHCEFLSLVGVGGNLDQKLVDCLGVGFAVNEDHTSANGGGLFGEPLFGIVEGSDGYGTDLTAFGHLNWHSQTLYRYNLYGPEGTFHIGSNMQQLPFFNSSFDNSSGQNDNSIDLEFI